LKNIKNKENAIRKSIVFYGPEPLKIIEKQTLFLILGHSKNNEKTIQKRFPKVIQNLLKATMGPSRFDLFIDIIDCGPRSVPK
jgi:hypothetical protein